MKIWFEGDSEIECDIQQVKTSFKNLGDHYVAVVGLMPGMTTVELLEQGDNFVTIRTNEGVMNRTNISIQIEAESVSVEFDEEYKAGSKMTGTSHYVNEFTAKGTGVMHRTVISDVYVSGFLGFLYRKFGGSNIGKAVLNAYKTLLEKK